MRPSPPGGEPRACQGRDDREEPYGRALEGQAEAADAEFEKRRVIALGHGCACFLAGWFWSDRNDASGASTADAFVSDFVTTATCEGEFGRQGDALQLAVGVTGTSASAQVRSPSAPRLLSAE